MRFLKTQRQTQNRPAAPDNPPDEASPKPPLHRRLIHLLIVAVLIPALLLGLTEMGLRLGGFGYPTSFFLKMPGQPAYQSNRRFGWRFFPRAVSRPPLPIRLPARKADNAYRIFILGGSVAQGFPPPVFGFHRILDVMLSEAYPGVDWQVVNVAMTAINSHVVLPIARDCAKHEPDMFIVYLGNNEVVGPYGPGSVLRGQVPSLAVVRAGLAIKKTRFGQLGDALGEKLHSSGDKKLTEWGGMSMFLDKQVPADDRRMRTVYEHFRRNLEDICRAGVGAGAEVLLCTVAVNLKDSPPFASQHRADLSEADLAEWQQAYDAGAAAAKAGDHAEAIEHFLAARWIDHGYAELEFRLGRCYLALGRTDEALTSYEAARDLDTLRFRADSKINDAIRQVPGQLSDSRVHLVDAEERFRRVAATPQLPGDDLFFEHVHMEFSGNYQLARLLFEQVAPLLPEAVAAKADPEPQPLSENQCAERLALTLWERQLMLQIIMGLAEGPPFTEQLDYADRRRAWRLRYLELERQQTFDAAEEACRIYRQALARRADDMTLHCNFGVLLLKLHDGEAEEHMRLALEELPDNPDRLFSMGYILSAKGKTAEAEWYFQRYLDSSCDRAAAYAALAKAFNQAIKPARALGYALDSLRHRPDQSNMLRIAGSCQLRLRQFPEAIASLGRAIELDPRSVDAYYDLALALAKSGRRGEAQQYIRQAVAADPYSFLPYLLQADMLAAQGKEEQAEEQYRLAVHLQPDDFEARRSYLRMLTGQKRYDQAIEQYRQALEYQPMSLEILNGLARMLALCPDPFLRVPAEALEHARLAGRITHYENTAILEVLAIAYAENDKFDEAVAIIDRAMLLAPSAEDKTLVARLRQYRRLFQAGRRLTNIK